MANQITSPRVTAVLCDDQMWVELEDGRTLGIPPVWFPRLLGVAPAVRAEVSISPSDLHWDALNKNISVAGLLGARGDATLQVDRPWVLNRIQRKVAMAKSGGVKSRSVVAKYGIGKKDTKSSNLNGAIKYRATTSSNVSFRNSNGQFVTKPKG